MPLRLTSGPFAKQATFRRNIPATARMCRRRWLGRVLPRRRAVFFLSAMIRTPLREYSIIGPGSIFHRIGGD